MDDAAYEALMARLNEAYPSQPAYTPADVKLQSGQITQQQGQDPVMLTNPRTLQQGESNPIEFDQSGGVSQLGAMMNAGSLRGMLDMSGQDGMTPGYNAMLTAGGPDGFSASYHRSNEIGGLGDAQNAIMLAKQFGEPNTPSPSLSAGASRSGMSGPITYDLSGSVPLTTGRNPEAPQFRLPSSREEQPMVPLSRRDRERQPSHQEVMGAATAGLSHSPRDHSTSANAGLKFNFADGGHVDAALHLLRQHFDEGGFLDSVRNLFSGPDYLSTGEAASPTNWGDPESAADFFKADRALRLAREVQAKDDVTGSTPTRAPLTAPRPGAVEVQELPVNIPFAAPERGAAMSTSAGPAPLSNFQTIPGAITPISSDFQRTAPQAASFATQPLAYTAAPIAAPAAAAIDQATGKLTARAPQGPDLNDRQRDLIIRTIAAETSGKTPEESQAIAHVILNRIQSGQYGATPEAVLFARKQFEPWSNPNGANYPMRFSPDSRRYGMGQAALDAALGADDITNGATNFWAPKAQAALGRPAPAWGRTGGVDIGETRFHNLSRAEGGEVEAPDEVNQALDVVRQADGEAVGQGQEAPTPEDAAVTIARSQPVTPASLARAWTTPEEAIEAGVGPRARTLMETYPVAVSKGIAAMPSAVAHSIQDPFELAHQAATNQLPPDYFHSDEGIGRALNAANLAMTGGLGGVEAATGETVLGAGPVRKVGMGHNMPPPDETFNLPQLLQTEKRRGVDVLNQTADLAGKDPKFSKFGAPLSDLEATISRKNDLVPYKSLSPEQLYREGAYIAPALGDLTGAGYMVHEINGIPLSRPVDVTGGGEYMRSAMANAQGQESAWASRPSTAQTMLNKINNQVPEGAPVYMSHTLMGVPSMDSSHMVMQGVLRQIPHLAGKIDPVGAMVVDDFIRSHLPANAQKDWPGILNADAAEAYLMGKPGTWSSTVVKALDKSGAVKAGFPDVGATRFAMMEPRLAAGNQLSSGFALSRLDPGGKLISNPMLGHETYAGKMPSIGGYAGGFENQIPMDKMFSDWFKGRPATYTEEATGLIKPTTKTMHQQAMMTQVPVQKATQQWLDTVMDHMRQNPQKWGYSSGGLANP